MKMDKARIERRIDFLLSQTKSNIYDYINKHEDFKKAWKHIRMLDKKGGLHPTVQLLKQNIDKMIDTSFEFSTRSTEILCEMYKNELFNNICHFKECDDSDDEYDASEYMTTPPTYNVVYNAMPSFHRGISFEVNRFQTRIRPIYDEVVAEYSKIIESVLLIQRAWRNAISNPTHTLCRTRLLNEFALGVTSRAEGQIPHTGTTSNSYLGNLVEGGQWEYVDNSDPSLSLEKIRQIMQYYDANPTLSLIEIRKFVEETQRNFDAMWPIVSFVIPFRSRVCS